jgi:hypothetical protein
MVDNLKDVPEDVRRNAVLSHELSETLWDVLSKLAPSTEVALNATLNVLVGVILSFDDEDPKGLAAFVSEGLVKSVAANLEEIIRKAN